MRPVGFKPHCSVGIWNQPFNKLCAELIRSLQFNLHFWVVSNIIKCVCSRAELWCINLTFFNIVMLAGLPVVRAQAWSCIITLSCPSGLCPLKQKCSYDPITQGSVQYSSALSHPYLKFNRKTNRDSSEQMRKCVPNASRHIFRTW